jgi:hypothetical protein
MDTQPAGLLLQQDNGHPTSWATPSARQWTPSQLGYSCYPSLFKGHCNLLYMTEVTGDFSCVEKSVGIRAGSLWLVRTNHELHHPYGFFNATEIRCKYNTVP